MKLHPFICDHLAREPQLIECQQAIWIEPVELRNYQLPPANERLIEDLIQMFTRRD